MKTKKESDGETVIHLSEWCSRRGVKQYESIIGRFIATSQSGVDKLQFSKEFMTAEEQETFDALLTAYRRAASDLSAFLREKRRRMRE